MEGRTEEDEVLLPQPRKTDEVQASPTDNKFVSNNSTSQHESVHTIAAIKAAIEAP